MRATAAGADAFGLLFGVRRGQTIYLVSTHRLSGLEPVGSFVCRMGGITLIDDDLQRSDQAGVRVMLVISGETAGVFVRDDAENVASLGDYQRACKAAEMFRVEAAPPLVAVTEPRRLRTTAGAGAFFALALVLVPFVYRPAPNPTVKIRDDKGQLHISWNSAPQNVLTILDRGERISVPIGAGQSSLTYARHSGDVTIGIGSTQVRFIGSQPAPSEIEKMRAGVETLESRIACLRAVLYSRRAKLVGLTSSSPTPTP